GHSSERDNLHSKPWCQDKINIQDQLCVLDKRASIAQRLISLSTLRSESRLSPRKTRSRLPARLCRTGLVTRRVPVEGFTFEMLLRSRASWRDVRPVFRSPRHQPSLRIL